MGHPGVAVRDLEASGDALSRNRYQPEPTERRLSCSHRVTFLTGANRDFPNWRRQVLGRAKAVWTDSRNEWLWKKSSLSFTDTEPYVRRGCRTEFSHFDPNSTFVPAGERSATRLITAAARTDHMRAARGAANLYQRSPQGHQPVRIRAPAGRSCAL